MDALDIKIIKEMMSEPDIRSAEIASKYKRPLSTIQRRRTRLEQTVLKKKYHIDIGSLGWREADLFVSVDKGDCEEVAKKLLERYNNVITASLRIGDPGVNVMAKVFYRKSEDLHDMIESIRTVPSVSAVKWSEVVRVVGTNDTSMIDAMFASPVRD